MKTHRYLQRTGITGGLACLLAVGGISTLCCAEEVEFARDIAPILTAHCTECHGPNVQKGKVSLQTRQHALGDGAWKKVVTPGKPDASELLRVVSGGDDAEMPKKGPKLNKQEVEKLRQWIAEGAVWPENVALKEKLSGGGDLWSLRPLAVETPPAAMGVEAPASRSSIDAFVDASLATARLVPAPEADRRTLIRRLSFTLHGLPPTPEDAAAFTADLRPDAYERLVDRYLASPHYGERWARHWLDIAHYADTHGFERDQKRENAWPYRDWVIRAFNDDMRYDDFIRLQVAGDVISPSDRNAVVATGFLAAGPWDFVGQRETPSPVLKRQARADDLDDMVTQVITSTLGLTINCARCHNHKLDPISQEDYYRLWAVFAGVTRGERELDPPAQPGLVEKQQSWQARLAVVEKEITKLSGAPLDLADIVGGGDGLGKGKRGMGIDPGTGKSIATKQSFLEAAANVYHPIRSAAGAATGPAFIDGVVIPDGSHPVPLSSTGVVAADVPKTTGKAWDAIRFGPVNAQASTVIDGVDYNAGGRSLLGLHANAGITFDLQTVRQVLAVAGLRFTAKVGYGGKAAGARADFHVYVDGVLAMRRMKFGAEDGGMAIDVNLPASSRFLTLMATDGGDAISHDQVFLGDPRISVDAATRLSPEEQAHLAALQTERDALAGKLAALPKAGKLYGVIRGEPPAVHVLTRGNPEAPAELVKPGALSCLESLPSDLGAAQTPEGMRRRLLSEWLVDPRNPLTARVLVNRLWHHHFGRGLVDTPSDFGNGGGRPSHPALLDWLAAELMKSGWSVKHLQKLILTSTAYRRGSLLQPDTSDSANRLLARMNARRLDAESLRDAVLAVSGNLNATMGGPGYQEFEYQEAYAPIYKQTTADRPELWRRSVYRFIVRTTPQRFMTTMDCPDPANLTPARLTTTTALQSLALMNNAFMLQQAGLFAKRVQEEAGPSVEAQVTRAFALAFQRAPDAEEIRGAAEIVRSQGLAALCRLLLNANEFVHLD